MNRALALIGAVLLATLTVSSACMATADDGLHFMLEPEHGNSGKIHAEFRDSRHGNDHTNWSGGFMPSELIGLDTSGFRSSGTRPLRFALVRDAGRLDCGGQGGGNFASGYCRFTPDAAFNQLLASHGVARPTAEEGLGLMAINVRRELVEAITSAGYPAPRIGDLMSLTALGVDGRYISEMARAGYRPRSLQSLVEFKAMNITPAWIGGFVRIGHANFPQDGLVQLKAMDITPEFVAGFDRIGYRDLSVDTLVQLKALNITPEFVRSAVGQRATMPAVHELVNLKLFGPNGRP
jgi:hypothetical protein